MLAASLAAAGLVSQIRPAYAAFSGQNGKIAFVSNRTTGEGVNNPTGDSEIFTINLDGTGLVQLTENNSTDVSPASFPDGERIAFESGRDGNYGSSR